MTVKTAPKSTFSLILSGLLMVGCVTINVYFPAVAAEKAADKIIEEVWGKNPPGAEPAAEPQSSLTGPADLLASLSIQLLNAVVPAAQAAEPDLDISSPAVQQIKISMEARHTQLEAHYASGAIGLTGNGGVAVRDANLIPLKDRNTVKKHVAEENADRSALYKEIALANGHPEWADDIRDTFAKRWISKAGKGWYYQSGGDWQRK
jgi:uncharacterized protein YdbL (DUF1318 family)